MKENDIRVSAAIRGTMAANIDNAMEYAHQAHKNAAAGQADLFSSAAGQPELVIKEAEPWAIGQMLEEERKAVGFHLTAHPLDDIYNRLYAHYAELGIEPQCISVGKKRYGRS